MGTATDSVVQTAVTALDLLALAVWIGACSFRLWVLPPGLIAADAAHVYRSLLRLLVACLVALVVSSIAILALRIAVISGEPLLNVLPLVPQVILNTHFGPVWAIRPICLLILGALLILLRRSTRNRYLWIVNLVAAAGFAASRCASGHAADMGDWNLQELVDWLHLMGISIWVGGVCLSLWSVFPELVGWIERQPRPAADFARRFSTSSGAALAVVLASGLFLVFARLSSIASLVNTDYGRTLAIKLILVAAIIATGAINRNVYVKRVEWSTKSRDDGSGNRDPRRAVTIEATRVATYFARNIAVESGLMLAALITVGSLLQQMPTRMMQVEHSSAPGSKQQEQTFALGHPAVGADAQRTVGVDLFDAKQCAPRTINVEAGEIVRFDVTNRGKVDHEFVIGDTQELHQHESMLQQMGDMPMPDEPNSLRLSPGQTKTIIWQFGAPGSFACDSLG